MQGFGLAGEPGNQRQGARPVDIDLLRTFLEVSRTRHFRKAADNLFVTQAAVSARIRQLEHITGVPLFTRARNNIQLTDAGHKLQVYAESIINTWNRARQEIAAEDVDKNPLAVGAVASLWGMMLNDWVNALYDSPAKLLLQAAVLDTSTLLTRMREGALDLALMYDTPKIGGLLVEEFAKIQLVMVSTIPGINVEDAIAEDYVFVDWGTAFSITHAQAFPELPTPVLRVDAGHLAHSFILNRGGNAYLAYQTVSEDIKSGKLFLVDNAPSIDRIAYAVYAAKSDRHDLIKRVIKLLRKISKQQEIQ